MEDVRVISERALPRHGEIPASKVDRTFAAAVERHQSLVFSLAYHMLRNAALAEEVAQEVYLRLYQDFGRIDSEPHMVHWLRRTTTHRCLDVLRRSAGRRPIPLEDVEVAAPTAALYDPILTRTLRRLVAELPAAARAVVVLRYQEDLDPREIAQVLDLPVNTVKSRLQRALIVLRGRFAALEESRHASTR
jgi:RNA polymerase sigma-70 factor (ECF subfamily)